MSEPKTPLSASEDASKRAASALGFGKSDKRVASLFGARAAAKDAAPKQLSIEEQIAAGADSEMRWIDYRDLEDNPWQPRESYDEAEVEDMKESLNAVGQMQPGIARPHPTKPGKFQIAVAHRRTRGVEAGGNAGVGRPDAHLYIGKVWFWVKALSDMEMRVLATRENRDRVDLNPMEYAKSYSNIRDLLGEGQRKMTWADVSKVTGLGVRQMRRYADLLDLPDAAQAKIRSGVWNERHGRALLSFERDDSRQAILMRTIEREGLSGAAAEKKAGQIRAAYATQREMDIADGAQRSHETVVAHQAVQIGQENRAALEAGQSHLSLVPTLVSLPAEPALSAQSATDFAQEMLVEAHAKARDDFQSTPARIEIETATPAADPIAELQTIAARLEFLAQDIASLAVVSPLLSRGVKGGITDCHQSLNKMLDALEGSYEK